MDMELEYSTKVLVSMILANQKSFEAHQKILEDNQKDIKENQKVLQTLMLRS
jgi:hypothetical protein